MANLWKITKFYGGLSTGSKVGTEASFPMGMNLDLHSDPDALQVNPNTAKDSGSTISDLVLGMTSEGINNDIYAIGDTGKFYKRTSGSWSLLRTLGGANGQGIGYFNNIIYFSSGNRLGTYNPATGAFNESYQALTTYTWHPLACFMDKIVVRDGQNLCSVDGSGIWNGSQLTIDNDYRIKSLEVIGGGNWLAIGTAKEDKTNSKLFLWDGFSTNYNEVVTIQENGINAILNADDVILINAGVRGNLYQYSSSHLIDIKTFPLVERNKTAYAYPYAVSNYQGHPLIAVSAGTSDTVKRGVYSWSRAEKNYPMALNIDFTPSHGYLTGTSREIGALFSEGENELYISWKNGSDYGIDIVDGSNIFASAEYYSLIYDANMPENVKYFTDAHIRLARPLRTGEAIALYYDKDNSGSWTSIGSIDYAIDGGVVEKSFDVQIRATTFQYKLVFSITGSTTPAVDSITSKFTIEPLI